jgi:hypothetical protein
VPLLSFHVANCQPSSPVTACIVLPGADWLALLNLDKFRLNGGEAVKAERNESSKIVLMRQVRCINQPHASIVLSKII